MTNVCAQLAIASLLVACNPLPPSSTPSPLDMPLSSSPVGSPSPVPIVMGDPFVKGVDKAASATTLAQAAQTADDWNLVLSQWQRAIDFMKAVPSASPNHAASQKLLVTYQQNLARAQQQAKRGGSSQGSIAVKGNTDGGIPLIVGGQPSASPSPTTEPSTVAITTINTLLQQQTEFFAKQKRFAANLTELGGGIPTDTPSYTYSTSVLPSKQAIATATAKQDGLPSYIGAFLSVKDDQNSDTTTTAICVTSKPAKAPPSVPQVVGKEIQCPAGSTKL